MAEYIVTDPETQRKLKMTGDSPPTDAEIEEAFSNMGTASEARTAATTNKLGGLLMETPRMLGRAPAAIAAGVQGLGGLATGGDFDFSRRFEENLQDAPFPASALQNIPAPTVPEASAYVSGAKAMVPGGRSPGEAYREDLAETETRNAMLAEQFPGSTMFGEGIGDVASLASIRGVTGVPKKIKTFEEWITKTGKFRKPDAYFGTSSIPEPVKKGLANWAKGKVTSKPLRHLAKGAGRSLETGLDAAVLSMLNDEDPMEMAAYAAGGQAMASAGLTAASHVFSGNIGTIGGKVAVYSVAAGSLWQLVKDATPGGEDSLIDSIEAGYEKVLFALTLGAVSAAVGGGRLRSGGKKSLAENSPIIADTLATFHRGAALTFLRSMVNADVDVQQDVETVMKKAWESPEFFDWLNSEQRKGLYKSMEDGTIVQYVEDLKAKSQEFQQRLFKAQKPKDKFPEMKAL